MIDQQTIKVKSVGLFSYSLFSNKPQIIAPNFNKMAKLIFALAVIMAVFALTSALGGVKDILGNYYDYTTGQVSSSLTGHVYNSAPAVVPVASYVSHYAAPYAASYVAGPVAYSAPLFFK